MHYHARMTAISPEQLKALAGRFISTDREALSVLATLAEAVAAADLYLNSYDTSAPSRIKAETRAVVEEAMALLRVQP